MSTYCYYLTMAAIGLCLGSTGLAAEERRLFDVDFEQNEPGEVETSLPSSELPSQKPTLASGSEVIGDGFNDTHTARLIDLDKNKGTGLQFELNEVSVVSQGEIRISFKIRINDIDIPSAGRLSLSLRSTNPETIVSHMTIDLRKGKLRFGQEDVGVLKRNHIYEISLALNMSSDHPTQTLAVSGLRSITSDLSAGNFANAAFGTNKAAVGSVELDEIMITHFSNSADPQ